MQLQDFEGNRRESINVSPIVSMKYHPKTRQGFRACFHPENWQPISYLDKVNLDIECPSR